MLLQIFGLGTVAVGLSKTRELFGRPSILARIVAWFGRVAAALRPPEPISLQGSVEMPVLVEDAELSIGPPANATVEQRVSILEKNQTRLREDVKRNAQTTQQELRRLEGNLTVEDQKLRSAVEANAKKIEESAIGGLHLEVVGLWWLFFGIIGTSIPDEAARSLAKLMAAVGCLGTVMR